MQGSLAVSGFTHGGCWTPWWHLWHTHKVGGSLPLQASWADLQQHVPQDTILPRKGGGKSTGNTHKLL